MVGDPTGLETDLTPGKNLRPQCCSKKSPPGQLGVPARSSYIRGVARWAGWPAPVLPGRNVGEAWPGHECCGRLRDAARGGRRANMVPTRDLLKGGLSSGLHGHRLGERGSL